MIRFKTLNSHYEVDQAGKRIRRLSGVSDPLPCQGTDGEWRAFEWIDGVVAGQCCELGLAELSPGDRPYLRTSTIKTVERVEECKPNHALIACGQ